MAAALARTARAESMIFQDPLMKIFVVSELMRLKRIELGPIRVYMSGSSAARMTRASTVSAPTRPPSTISHA
jgi:hypothetical protein